jgi:hypothetical protein
MRTRTLNDRRCSYVVVIDGESVGDLREFAAYLSDLGVARCDVVIVDESPEHTFARHRRILCWVGRHIAPRPRHRDALGGIDPVSVALDVAGCEKVVVADPAVRYGAQALDDLCAMLDTHDAVGPQDYFEPMPWWCSIDAGRMLVHRGIEPLPDHGATFAFRRSAVRATAVLDARTIVPGENVFVRRLPPPLYEWLDQRPRQAGDDFDFPVKTAFFFALIPLALLLFAAGGARLAGSYAGAIAFGAFALAVRGRLGAAPFFPLRACLAAPLWVFERSVSVYWALMRRLKFILRREAPADVASTSANGTPALTARSRS